MFDVIWLHCKEWYFDGGAHSRGWIDKLTAEVGAYGPIIEGKQREESYRLAAEELAAAQVAQDTCQGLKLMTMDGFGRKIVSLILGR